MTGYILPPSGPMVEAIGVDRDFGSGDAIVHALRGIDLAVGRGELVAVKGRSGSGKTTLLNVLGGLDRPTAGRVIVDGADVTAMGEADLVRLRRRSVAYIFQAFGLVPILSAAENVEIPLRLVNAEPRGARPPRPGPARARRPGRARPAPPATSCRGANSSGSPSPAPSPTSPGSCWPTNRRASSTSRPGTRS